MANRFAVANGNFSATSTWSTTAGGSSGASVPVAGDVAMSNNRTVTINADATCDEVRNDTTGGATAGGTFDLTNGVTLTANVFAGTAGAACVRFNVASPAIAYVVGNSTGGSANNSRALANDNTGTLEVTGNITGGTTNATAYGLWSQSTGTTTVTGNVTAGSAGVGANISVAGTLTITGDVLGGGAANANGAQNASTGTLTINGKATASASAHGAVNNSTGTLNVIRAVANGYGPNATGVSLVYGVFNNVIGSQSTVQELEFGSRGMVPVNTAVLLTPQTTNTVIFTTSTGIKTLVDSASAEDYPAESDVRDGVEFNFGNNEGTCAVPAASSVAFGVPVDATTGTAVLTPAAVWNALTSGMTTSGSIGARLKNAATLDSTGQQLADALSPVP
jgi:hypothetical protein